MKFKEYVLLKTISQCGTLSQQRLAKIVGVAPSMINRYISNLEENGFIKKMGPNKKKMQYLLTDEGRTRLQYLTVLYFNEIARLHRESTEVFKKVFEKLWQEGIRKLVLYGGGVIGKTLTELLINEGFKVVFILDEDEKKHGQNVFGVPIIPPEKFQPTDQEAILIASFKRSEEIYRKVKKMGLENVYIFRIETTGQMYLERGE